MNDLRDRDTSGLSVRQIAEHFAGAPEVVRDASTVAQFPESRLSRSVELSGQLAEALADDIGAPPTPVGTVGKDDPANPGRELAPLPAVLSPLHELEESLLALLDTEELVTEEREQAFLEDLSHTMQATVAKRDRVAAFIKHCEAQVEVCADEIQRLQARKRVLANAAERVRSYVLWIIEALGPDAEGKLRKLEGDKFTFATRKAKPKLEITDESSVPQKYKWVKVGVPAEQFERYRGILRELFGTLPALDYSLNEAGLRAALEGAPEICAVCGGDGNALIASGSQVDGSGEYYPCPHCGGSGVVPPSVPGARLLTDRNSLVLR
jgi:Siphovirus Gp157